MFIPMRNSGWNAPGSNSGAGLGVFGSLSTSQGLGQNAPMPTPYPAQNNAPTGPYGGAMPTGNRPTGALGMGMRPNPQSFMSWQRPFMNQQPIGALSQMRPPPQPQAMAQSQPAWMNSQAVYSYPGGIGGINPNTGVQPQNVNFGAIDPANFRFSY